VTDLKQHLEQGIALRQSGEDIRKLMLTRIADLEAALHEIWQLSLDGQAEIDGSDVGTGAEQLVAIAETAAAHLPKSAT
jgi:hypothetical protein